LFQIGAHNELGLAAVKHRRVNTNGCVTARQQVEELYHRQSKNVGDMKHNRTALLLMLKTASYTVKNRITITFTYYDVGVFDFNVFVEIYFSSNQRQRFYRVQFVFIEAVHL